MQYKFTAYGHPNILAAHKAALEFTKDKELSLKGDCIIGVNADFDLGKIKEFIKQSKTNKIAEITIEAFGKSNKKIKETILAELNPDFDSNKEMVIRKADFVSERTFAIRANKASFGLNRDLIEFLKEKKNRISITIENNKLKKDTFLNR